MALRTTVGQPFVITFQQQSVREVIDKTGGRAFGGRSHRVIRRVITPDQFNVVHDGRIQIQACQFITRLNPPTPRLYVSDVGRLLPGVDIFTLHFNIGTEVNGGVQHQSRPQIISRPGAGLARNIQFKIIMCLPRVKPSDASAAAGAAVEIGVVAAAGHPNVAAQVKIGHAITTAIKRKGVGAAIHGTGPVDAINGIGEHLS